MYYGTNPLFLDKNRPRKVYSTVEYQPNTRLSSRHLKIRCSGMKIPQSVFRIGKL